MKRVVTAVLCALLLASCSATIARHEVRQAQASHSSTGQDSGILVDHGNKPGFLVNQDWLNGYDALLERYGDKLTPKRTKGDRDGIEKEGNYYRITDAAMERQLVLNQRRIDEGP